MPIFRRWHIGPRLAARAVSFLLIYALAAWAMPNALLYDVISAMVSAAAAGVLTAYVPGVITLIAEDREPTSSDYLIMGICTAWLARDGSTAWGWAWRFAGRPGWMPDHWFPLLMLAITFASAGLHLTADAVDGVVPTRVWVARGLVVTGVLGLAFVYIAWNLSHGGYMPDA